MTIVYNQAMDNILEQLHATDLPRPMITALDNFARESISKSVVLDIMNATFLQVPQREGINRWLNMIDDARVTGILPTPEVPTNIARSNSTRASAEPKRTLVSVELPAPRRSRSASCTQRHPCSSAAGPSACIPADRPSANTRSRSRSRSRTSISSHSSEHRARESGHSSSVRYSSSVSPEPRYRGKERMPHLPLADQGSESGSDCSEDEKDRYKRKSHSKNKKYKKQEKIKGRALRKSEERRCREDRASNRRKRKAKKHRSSSKNCGSSKSVKRPKTGASGMRHNSFSDSSSCSESSDGDSIYSLDSAFSESSSSSSSPSSCDSYRSTHGHRKHSRSTLPFKFRPGRFERNWKLLSRSRKCKMTMKWKSAVANPKVWYSFYRRHLRLKEGISTAHAWKLTQSWNTDVQIVGCNMHINFASKSVRELEEALSATAQRRIDYYAWRSAVDSELATWEILMPWLSRDVRTYRRQLDELWDDLRNAFAPRTYLALQRIQAAHVHIMQALDQDPFSIIGSQSVFERARLRFTGSFFANANDVPFEPTRWLEPEHQNLIIAAPGAPRNGVNKPPEAGKGKKKDSATPAAAPANANTNANVDVQYCQEYNNNPNGCTRRNCRYVHRCAVNRTEGHTCNSAAAYRVCQQRTDRPQAPRQNQGQADRANQAAQ